MRKLDFIINIDEEIMDTCKFVTDAKRLK